MRCRNVASARLVSILSRLHMSATAACYCTARHSTQTCSDELQSRVLIGACRIAPPTARRPLRLAPQHRQQKCNIGDEDGHLMVQPSEKFRTTRGGLHACRTVRQDDLTTAADKTDMVGLELIALPLGPWKDSARHDRTRPQIACQPE
jgi:hypothetical protein